MCGILGMFGEGSRREVGEAMLRVQKHRGPDGNGLYVSPSGRAVIGQNRLSIIDLSERARQPMTSASGRYTLSLNGEIYNYLELRRELEAEQTFRSQSDTEVLLAAFEKWGPACLDKLIGMFAFIIWDELQQTAFIARDRFGVKPLYYHHKADGTLLVASEIKAIHETGVRREPDPTTWAGYLARGTYGEIDATFWAGIKSLPGGHSLCWESGRTTITKWYDLAQKVGDAYDQRPESEVAEEYFGLMKDSVKLRFRSDVPVGINLSGGLDSSTLLGLVHAVQGEDSDVKAFTFATGDANYDELPWVEEMLAATRHPLVVSTLAAVDVPLLAADVQKHQDEPFGGLPTLAYARLFEAAKSNGVTVLLDGNGMDEQWAGYDYYQASSNGHAPHLVQGTKELPVKPECLDPHFLRLSAEDRFSGPFKDELRNLQYRDAVLTKIPRAMRFNDRVSMRASRELREPFLDHRLFELAMRQSPERKVRDGVGKWMLREIAGRFIPSKVSAAPKRPMQTPQREWLRGPLREWATSQIEAGLAGPQGAYLYKARTRQATEAFFNGESDNSFYIWQWISLGLMSERRSAQAIAN